jgi:hypothetical protein
VRPHRAMPLRWIILMVVLAAIGVLTLSFISY